MLGAVRGALGSVRTAQMPREGGTGGANAFATFFDPILTDGFNLTGIDPLHSQHYTDVFDALSRWTSNGAAPIVVATEEGAFLRSNGNGSLQRGYTVVTPGAPGSVAAAASPRPFLLNQTTPWFLSAGFRIKTFSATGFGLHGPRDPATVNAGVIAGYIGSTSTTVFSGFKSDGAGGIDTALSTIPVDGAWHRVDTFADGSGFYFFSVDREPKVSFPNAHPLANVLAASHWSVSNAGTSLFDIAWSVGIWGVPY